MRKLKELEFKPKLTKSSRSSKLKRKTKKPMAKVKILMKK